MKEHGKRGETKRTRNLESPRNNLEIKGMAEQHKFS